MPAVLGPLVGVAIGALLALFCGRDAGREGMRSSATRVAMLLGALVYAPVCGYFLWAAPDWASLYLVDAARIPSALWLVLAVVDAASVPFGFTLASRLFDRGNARGAIALGLAPLAASVIVIAAFVEQLTIDGTYRQVHLAFGTQRVAGGRLGWAILWMLALTIAGFFVALAALADRPLPPRKEGPRRFLGRARDPEPRAPSPPSSQEQGAPIRRLGQGAFAAKNKKR